MCQERVSQCRRQTWQIVKSHHKKTRNRFNYSYKPDLNQYPTSEVGADVEISDVIKEKCLEIISFLGFKNFVGAALSCTEGSCSNISRLK